MAAVSAGPDADLTAVGIAAAGIVVPCDRLHLCIKDVGITRRHCNFDASELVPVAGTDSSATCNRIVTRNAAVSIHVRTGCVWAACYRSAEHKAIIVAAARGEVGWATADWHRAFINPIRAVGTKVILHKCRETTHAHRRDDASDASTHVRYLQPCYVLALCTEAISRAGASPVNPAVIREVETLLRAGNHVVTVVRVHSH